MRILKSIGWVFLVLLMGIFLEILICIEYISEIMEEKMKLRCKLGWHKWGKWGIHPFYGNKVTRNCLFCRCIQDRRL